MVFCVLRNKNWFETSRVAIFCIDAIVSYATIFQFTYNFYLKPKIIVVHIQNNTLRLRLLSVNAIANIDNQRLEFFCSILMSMSILSYWLLFRNSAK